MNSFHSNVSMLKQWLDVLHGGRGREETSQANAELTYFQSQHMEAWNCCIAILYLQLNEKFLVSAVYEDQFYVPGAENKSSAPCFGDQILIESIRSFTLNADELGNHSLQRGDLVLTRTPSRKGNKQKITRVEIQNNDLLVFYAANTIAKLSKRVFDVNSDSEKSSSESPNSGMMDVEIKEGAVRSFPSTADAEKAAIARCHVRLEQLKYLIVQPEFQNKRDVWRQMARAFTTGCMWTASDDWVSVTDLSPVLQLDIYALVPTLAFFGNKVGLDHTSWHNFMRRIVRVSAFVMREIAGCLDLETLSDWVKGLRQIQEYVSHDVPKDLLPALELLLLPTERLAQVSVRSGLSSGVSVDKSPNCVSTSPANVVSTQQLLQPQIGILKRLNANNNLPLSYSESFLEVYERRSQLDQVAGISTNSSPDSPISELLLDRELESRILGNGDFYLQEVNLVTQLAKLGHGLRDEDNEDEGMSPSGNAWEEDWDAWNCDSPNNFSFQDVAFESTNSSRKGGDSLDNNYSPEESSRGDCNSSENVRESGSGLSSQQKESALKNKTTDDTDMNSPPCYDPVPEPPSSADLQYPTNEITLPAFGDATLSNRKSSALMQGGALSSEDLAYQVNTDSTSTEIRKRFCVFRAALLKHVLVKKFPQYHASLSLHTALKKEMSYLTVDEAELLSSNIPLFRVLILKPMFLGEGLINVKQVNVASFGGEIDMGSGISGTSLNDDDDGMMNVLKKTKTLSDTHNLVHNQSMGPDYHDDEMKRNNILGSSGDPDFPVEEVLGTLLNYFRVNPVVRHSYRQVPRGRGTSVLEDNFYEIDHVEFDFTLIKEGYALVCELLDLLVAGNAQWGGFAVVRMLKESPFFEKFAERLVFHVLANVSYSEKALLQMCQVDIDEESMYNSIGNDIDASRTTVPNDSISKSLVCAYSEKVISGLQFLQKNLSGKAMNTSSSQNASTSVNSGSDKMNGPVNASASIKRPDVPNMSFHDGYDLTVLVHSQVVSEFQRNVFDLRENFAVPLLEKLRKLISETQCESICNMLINHTKERVMKADSRDEQNLLGQYSHSIGDLDMTILVCRVFGYASRLVQFLGGDFFIPVKDMVVVKKYPYYLITELFQLLVKTFCDNISKNKSSTTSSKMALANPKSPTRRGGKSAVVPQSSDEDRMLLVTRWLLPVWREFFLNIDTKCNILGILDKAFEDAHIASLGNLNNNTSSGSAADTQNTPGGPNNTADAHPVQEVFFDTKGLVMEMEGVAAGRRREQILASYRTDQKKFFEWHVRKSVELFLNTGSESNTLYKDVLLNYSNVALHRKLLMKKTAVASSSGSAAGTKAVEASSTNRGSGSFHNGPQQERNTEKYISTADGTTICGRVLQSILPDSPSGIISDDQLSGVVVDGVFAHQNALLLRRLIHERATVKVKMLGNNIADTNNPEPHLQRLRDANLLRLWEPIMAYFWSKCLVKLISREVLKTSGDFLGFVRSDDLLTVPSRNPLLGTPLLGSPLAGKWIHFDVLSTRKILLRAFKQFSKEDVEKIVIQDCFPGDLASQYTAIRICIQQHSILPTIFSTQDSRAGFANQSRYSHQVKVDMDRMADTLLKSSLGLKQVVEKSEAMMDTTTDSSIAKISPSNAPSRNIATSMAHQMRQEYDRQIAILDYFFEGINSNSGSLDTTVTAARVLEEYLNEIVLKRYSMTLRVLEEPWSESPKKNPASPTRSPGRMPLTTYANSTSIAGSNKRTPELGRSSVGSLSISVPTSGGTDVNPTPVQHVGISHSHSRGDKSEPKSNTTRLSDTPLASSLDGEFQAPMPGLLMRTSLCEMFSASNPFAQMLSQETLDFPSNDESVGGSQGNGAIGPTKTPPGFEGMFIGKRSLHGVPSKKSSDRSPSRSFNKSLQTVEEEQEKEQKDHKDLADALAWSGMPEQNAVSRFAKLFAREDRRSSWLLNVDLPIALAAMRRLIEKQTNKAVESDNATPLRMNAATGVGSSVSENNIPDVVQNHSDFYNLNSLLKYDSSLSSKDGSSEDIQWLTFMDCKGEDDEEDQEMFDAVFLASNQRTRTDQRQTAEKYCYFLFGVLSSIQMRTKFYVADLFDPVIFNQSERYESSFLVLGKDSEFLLHLFKNLNQTLQNFCLIAKKVLLRDIGGVLNLMRNVPIQSESGAEPITYSDTLKASDFVSLFDHDEGPGLLEKIVNIKQGKFGASKFPDTKRRCTSSSFKIDIAGNSSSGDGGAVVVESLSIPLTEANVEESQRRDRFRQKFHKHLIHLEQPLSMGFYSTVFMTLYEALPHCTQLKCALEMLRFLGNMCKAVIESNRVINFNSELVSLIDATSITKAGSCNRLDVSGTPCKLNESFQDSVGGVCLVASREKRRTHLIRRSIREFRYIFSSILDAVFEFIIRNSVYLQTQKEELDNYDYLMLILDICESIVKHYGVVDEIEPNKKKVSLKVGTMGSGNTIASATSLTPPRPGSSASFDACPPLKPGSSGRTLSTTTTAFSGAFLSSSSSSMFTPVKLNPNASVFVPGAGSSQEGDIRLNSPSRGDSQKRLSPSDEPWAATITRSPPPLHEPVKPPFHSGSPRMKARRSTSLGGSDWSSDLGTEYFSTKRFRVDNYSTDLGSPEFFAKIMGMNPRQESNASSTTVPNSIMSSMSMTSTGMTKTLTGGTRMATSDGVMKDASAGSTLFHTSRHSSRTSNKDSLENYLHVLMTRYEGNISIGVRTKFIKHILSIPKWKGVGWKYTWCDTLLTLIEDMQDEFTHT